MVAAVLSALPEHFLVKLRTTDGEALVLLTAKLSYY